MVVRCTERRKLFLSMCLVRNVMSSNQSVPTLLERGNGMYIVSPSAKVLERSDNPIIPVEDVPADEIQSSVISEDSSVIFDVADDESNDSRGESSDDRVSQYPSPVSTAEETVDTPKEVPNQSSQDVPNQSSKEVSNQSSKEIAKDTPKKRRSPSKDWRRKAGRSNKATPAFLSHPNGPFSVYFEPQIDRRTHSAPS